MKCTRGNVSLNFQHSRNPGKDKRKSKECIASLGKSLFTLFSNWHETATKANWLTLCSKKESYRNGWIPEPKSCLEAATKINAETEPLLRFGSSASLYCLLTRLTKSVVYIHSPIRVKIRLLIAAQHPFRTIAARLLTV